MRILAFDPGVHCGWSLVDVTSGLGRAVVVTYVDGGVIDASSEEVHGLAKKTTPLIIGIEKVIGGGYAGAGKGAAQVSGALVETNWRGGTINGIAYALGIKVIEMPARTWRGMICGNPSAKDIVVKGAVETLVRNMPKRSNSHLRDAVGVALGVAWSEAGRRAA